MAGAGMALPSLQFAGAVRPGDDESSLGTARKRTAREELPISARLRLPVSARLYNMVGGHPDHVEMQRQGSLGRRVGAYDDAEMALTHAQEGGALARALADVGDRHARKLASMPAPVDRRNNRKRTYEAAVTLEQAKSSMCFVSELDDGLHRGERLWSCQGVAVALPPGRIKGLRGPDVDDFPEHSAVFLSTRSALLHEFAAKRSMLVFAVPAPAVAVPHRADEADDYSVTPTESEDETDVAQNRFPLGGTRVIQTST